MNILHVVDMISQQTAGGSAKVPYQLARAQAKLGHDVAIYTSDYNAQDQEAPEGVELVKFKCVLNLLGGIRITPGMLFAKFRQFDVIHLHNYRTFVNIIAANRSRPYVLQAHGSCLPIRSKIKWLHDWLWRSLILSRASWYIADAPLEETQYVREGAKVRDIITVPIGLDLDEFSNLPPRYPKEFKTVLYLGRLDRMKGPDLLARAFALLGRPDVRLAIAGVDYGYERNLKLLVGALGIADRVDYIGELHGIDKLKTYVNADVYVMPSRYEMWGLTFMEALACGTPVIMTDKCQAASILPQECGVVVPFDDMKLAKAITKVLDDGFAEEYRQFRIDWVSQFNWDAIAERMLEVYGEVIAG